MFNRKGCGAGSLRKGYVMAVRLDNRQADFEARFETLLAAKREATAVSYTHLTLPTTLTV